MRKRTLLAAAAVMVAVLTPLAPPAGASTTKPVRWHACPTYSDEVLEAMGTRPDDLARTRAVLARLRCGTVEVPLDHRHPGGRLIAVEITRLPALDPAHRLERGQ